MPQLNNMRVAIIALDGFEEMELTEPREALMGAGANVDVISEKRGRIEGFHHHDKGDQVGVDRILDEVDPAQYDALMLPGGALNADQARMNPQIRRFIREFDSAGKPIAAICHAPWELISAGVLQGRKLTSWPTIQDDIRNAGAKWVDQEMVRDGNWVSSRSPKDLPAFNPAMIQLFSESKVTIKE